MKIVLHLAAAMFAVLPLNSAAAHPHIFIETGLQLIFDDQSKLAAVRIVWVYDEFFSLVILEDNGLDPDGDGVLTDAERKTIQGFDMNWDPGFAGDLYALQSDLPLALSGPLEFTATLENGRLISTHLRAFETRVAVDDEPVRLQVYDPDYYTAYTMAIEPIVQGRAGCKAQIFVPDPTKASKELEAALAELSAVQTLDDLGVENFPAIGAAYSEEVQVTCAP
jgi:ABC-type uncharacterized transport system substrate-binding protein